MSRVFFFFFHIIFFLPVRICYDRFVMLFQSFARSPSIPKRLTSGANPGT